MSTPNRVSPGVPTGGQFAAKQNSAPTGIQLATASTAGTDPDEWAALSRDQLNCSRDQERIEVRSARLLARKVLAQYPTATHLELHCSDQGDDEMTAVAVHRLRGDKPSELLSKDELWGNDDIGDLAGNLREHGDWTGLRSYPFGKPVSRHHTGRPCLDLQLAAHTPLPGDGASLDRATRDTLVGQLVNATMKLSLASPDDGDYYRRTLDECQELIRSLRQPAAPHDPGDPQWRMYKPGDLDGGSWDELGSLGRPATAADFAGIASTGGMK